MGDRPWGASSSLRALKNSNQRRTTELKNSSLAGCGGENRFLALSVLGSDEEVSPDNTPDPKKRDVSPSSPVLGKPPSPILAEASVCSEVNVSEGEEDVEVYDEATEGAFERLALDALDKAKQGRSPLNKKDMDAIIEWLAWYRESPSKGVSSDFPSAEPKTKEESVEKVVAFDLVVADINEVQPGIPGGGVTVKNDSASGEGDVAQKQASDLVTSSEQGSNEVVEIDFKYGRTKSGQGNTTESAMFQEPQMGDNGGLSGPVSSVFSAGIHPVVNELHVAKDGEIREKQIGKISDRLQNAHKVFVEMPVLVSPQPHAGVFAVAKQDNVGYSVARQVLDKRQKGGDGACLKAVLGKHEVPIPSASGCIREAMEQAGGNGSKPAADGWLPSSQEQIQGMRSWAHIVGNGKQYVETSRLNHRSSLESKLEFFAPKAPGIIDIDDNLLEEHPWDTCLVGYFLETSLAFGLVRATAMKLWRQEGLQEVKGNDSGVMFFKFESMQQVDNILEKGPWYFSGKLLILRKWRKRLKLAKEAVSKIPIWVKFIDLPLEFWNVSCLSRISSAIGNPLFLDKATDTKQRISYARVCIEIEAKKPLIHSVFVRCEGEEIEVPVEYQGLPPMCARCNAFGHATSFCKDNNQSIGVLETEGKGSREALEIESEVDSSASSEWIKVRRRRVQKDRDRVKTSAVKAVALEEEFKGHENSVAVKGKMQQKTSGFKPASAGISDKNGSLVQSLPGASSRPLGLVGCSVPPPSPASQAALAVKAIDGGGKLGK